MRPGVSLVMTLSAPDKENNQGPDGIRIPEVLVPYTGFKTITGA